VLEFFCEVIRTMPKPQDDAALQKEADDQMDVVRLIGLNILSAALETIGTRVLGIPPLLRFSRRTLCQTIISASQAENLFVISFVMRLLCWLCSTMRGHLKMQIEIMIREVLMRIIADRTASQDARELAFDTVAELSSHPSFLPELYVNYDADLYGTALCESVLNMLKRYAFPTKGAEFEASHSAVLRAMVSAVHGMALRSRRQESDPPNGVLGGEPALDLNHFVTHKEAMHSAAQSFNAKPKKTLDALEMLQPLTPAKAALFLRENPFLNKQAIGVFLGEIGNDLSKAVLQSFVTSFSFQGLSFDTSLRKLLLSFRLPGEAQQIDAIMESFAAHFCDSNPGIFNSADTAYTLAFSTMMLNTDLHNPSVRKKMSPADWLRNNRGIDKIGEATADLPEDVLMGVYTSIKANEIKMSDDIASEDKDYIHWEYAEADVCRNHGYLEVRDTSCDHMLFSKLWVTMLPALATVFEAQQTDEDLLTLAVDGYMFCVEVAAKMQLPAVIDGAVTSLLRATDGLKKAQRGPLWYLASSQPSQLSLRTLFRVAREYGNYLKDGWSGVVEAVKLLHRLDLLPAPLTEITDESHALSLKRVPSPNSTTRLKKSSSVGSLSRVLFGDPEEELENMEEEARMQKSLAKVVLNYDLPELFGETKFLEAQSVCSLVAALSVGNSGPTDWGPEEEEGCLILHLELLVHVLLQNRDRFMVLWLTAKPFLTKCIQSKPGSPLQERGVMSALRLCGRLLHKPEVEEELLGLLGLLLELPERVMLHLAPGVSRGLLQILESNPAFAQQQPSQWVLPLALIEKMGFGKGETAGVSLECLSHLIRNSQVLTRENTLPCLQALERYLPIVNGVPNSTFSPPWCRKSLDLLLAVHTRLCANEGTAVAEWPEHCKVVLAHLTVSCREADYEVSRHAMRCLQRALLQGKEALPLSTACWVGVFEEILAPILEHGANAPALGGARGATLMNASLLFVGVLVPVVKTLAKTPKFCQMWRKYLTQLAALTRIEGCSELSEKVPLLLGALLRRMCIGGLFASPTGGKGVISDSSALWKAALESGLAFSPNLTPQQLYEMATTGAAEGAILSF